MSQFSFDIYDRVPGLMLSAEIVIFSITNNRLHVFMAPRQGTIFGGMPALPGRFLKEDTSLTGTASNLLNQMGIYEKPIDQFGVFSKPDRDPRNRSVSIAFLCVVTQSVANGLVDRFEKSDLFEVREDQKGEVVLFRDIIRTEASFDHGEIIKSALADLRAKIRYTTIGFDFLGEYFTLSALQNVHELVHGHALNKVLFRKRMLLRKFEDDTVLKRTPATQIGALGRPAHIYKRVREPYPDDSKF